MAGITIKTLNSAPNRLGKRSLWLLRGIAWLALAFFSAVATAAKLDELPLDRWAKLGEADRYQLNAAEKYFRQNDWKAALSEYEKFLSLYEKSEGAPFAQLKWAICQANLRKQNTAIKDGYQSVIDYWPDSPEATSAAYLIGKTYKDMAEMKSARKAYAKVLSDHPNTLPALLARIDLADIARVEGDQKRRLALLNEIVFRTDRAGDAEQPIREVSQQLAMLHFENADFAAGQKALATSVSESDLPYQIVERVRGPISQLNQNPATQAGSQKLADAAIADLLKRLPNDLTEEQQKKAFRQLYYWIAELQLHAGRLDAMNQTFATIMAKLGADDETLRQQGGRLRQFNRRVDARAVYARMKSPVDSQREIAETYREEHNFTAAIPIYTQLAANDPDRAHEWNWLLALSLKDAGQFKEAIGAFRACDRFPEDLREIAFCFRKLGDAKEAVSLYSQVASGHPASAPGATLEIARTYEESGEKERAIKAFQQVCKKFPQSGEASAAHAHLQDKYKINATLGGAKDE